MQQSEKCLGNGTAKKKLLNNFLLLDFEIGLSGGFYLVSYHLLYKNILTHESKAQPYTICFSVQKYAKKYVYLKYDIFIYNVMLIYVIYTCIKY